MAEYQQPSRRPITNPHGTTTSPPSKSLEAWRATEGFPSNPTSRHNFQTSLTAQIPRENSTEQKESSRRVIFKHTKRPKISTPYDPVHLKHVGFNSSTGEFTGLPREWQQISQEGYRVKTPMNNLVDEFEQAGHNSLKAVEIRPHGSGRNKNHTINTAQQRKGILSFILAMFNFTKRPARLEISTPFNPIHLTHVGFNSSTGEFTGLPKEWQQILQESFVDAQMKDLMGQSQHLHWEEPVETPISRPPKLSNPTSTSRSFMVNAERSDEWRSAKKTSNSNTPEMQERLGHGPLAFILQDIHHSG